MWHTIPLIGMQLTDIGRHYVKWWVCGSSFSIYHGGANDYVSCGKIYEWFILNMWLVFILVHTDTWIPWSFLELIKMFLKSRSRNPEGQVKGLEGLGWAMECLLWVQTILQDYERQTTLRYWEFPIRISPLFSCRNSMIMAKVRLWTQNIYAIPHSHVRYFVWSLVTNAHKTISSITVTS